jgi:hypothetical protein
MTQKIYIKSDQLKAFIRKNKLSSIESLNKISVEQLLRTGVTECASCSQPWYVGDEVMEVVMTTPRVFRFMRINNSNIVVETLDTNKQKLIKRDVFDKNKNKMMCLLGITELEYTIIHKNLM